MKQVLQFLLPQPAVRHTRIGFETIPANLSRAELFRYFALGANIIGIYDGSALDPVPET